VVHQAAYGDLEHPTNEASGVVERAVRNSSKSRDTISNVFGGRTTLIA